MTATPPIEKGSAVKKARVDLWLSVVPDPAEYKDLAHVPAARVRALMSMVNDDVVLPKANTDDQRGGWTNNYVDFDEAAGEANPELIYQLVNEKVALYSAARKTALSTNPPDWSQSAKLVLHSSSGTGDKFGQYYYNDKVTRWCRYRMAIVRTNDASRWILRRNVDKKDLTASIDISVAVEMLDGA